MTRLNHCRSLDKLLEVWILKHQLTATFEKINIVFDGTRYNFIMYSDFGIGIGSLISLSYESL